jgi:hypothetical protein
MFSLGVHKDDFAKLESVNVMIDTSKDLKDKYIKEQDPVKKAELKRQLQQLASQLRNEAKR